MKANSNSVVPPRNPAKAQAKRNEVERTISVGNTQDESYPSDIVEQRDLAIGIDLAPELADMDVDQIGLRRTVTPDVLEQHVARHHLGRAPHQISSSLNSRGN